MSRLIWLAFWASYITAGVWIIWQCIPNPGVPGALTTLYFWAGLGILANIVQRWTI